MKELILSRLEVIFLLLIAAYLVGFIIALIDEERHRGRD